MIIISMLMMLQGLMCLLLTMPKYAKQITGYQARDKRLSNNLNITGWLLLAGSFTVLLTQLGIGNGFVWLCASLTLIGTMITLAFSLSASFTAKWFLFIPVNLVQASKGKACLPIYVLLFLISSFLIQ